MKKRIKQINVKSGLKAGQNNARVDPRLDAMFRRPKVSTAAYAEPLNMPKRCNIMTWTPDCDILVPMGGIGGGGIL